MAGDSVNEWSRNLAVSESSNGFGMSPSERVILEEIGVLRMMLGIVLKRILKPEDLEEVRKNADRYSSEYGRQLLAKRSSARSDRGPERS